MTKVIQDPKGLSLLSAYREISNMSKRVTIMIDDDLDKKLRVLQAKIIQQTESSYSFSKILNETLRKGLK